MVTQVTTDVIADGAITTAKINTTQIATTAFATAAAAAAIPAMHINGFLPSSIAGTNTTASLTVSAGQATNTTGAAIISKGTTTSWAVSNGNAINGYSGGATLPNSSTIHFYACTGASGTGIYAIPNASYPLAAASAPSGYNTSVRRVFSLNTDSSGNLLPVNTREIGGGATVNYLVTPTLDINTTTLGTSRTLYTLNVPLGFRVQILYRANNSTTNSIIYFTSGDETDLAGVFAAWNTAPGADMWMPSAASSYTRDGFITTNSSGQIGARANNNAVNLYLVTRGFTDFRRD